MPDSRKCKYVSDSVCMYVDISEKITFITQQQQI